MTTQQHIPGFEGFDPAELAALTPDARNEAAELALSALLAAPSYETMAEVFAAISAGLLVVDVGSSAAQGPPLRNGQRNGQRKAKKTATTRIRVLRSTRGKLVLPLFTSMAELRLAVPAREQESVRGAIMPATKALALIRTDRFVGAQLNPGSAAVTVQRSYLERLLAGEVLTAAALSSPPPGTGGFRNEPAQPGV